MSQNNKSSKMIIAENIRNRRSTSYARSKDYTYFNIIIKSNIEQNEELLSSLGYNLYMQYFNKVSRSSNSIQRDRINTMLSSINANRPLQSTQKQSVGEFIYNASFTFQCSVIVKNDDRSILIINNFKLFQYKLIAGKKYIFDLSDPTNKGTLFSFSKRKYLNKDVDGINWYGTPGESDAYMSYTPSVLDPYFAVYVYDKTLTSKKAFDRFGYSVNRLLIEVPYRNKKVGGDLSRITDDFKNKNIIGMESRTIFHSIEFEGPRYMFTSDSDLNKIKTEKLLNYIETITRVKKIEQDISFNQPDDIIYTVSSNFLDHLQVLAVNLDVSFNSYSSYTVREQIKELEIKLYGRELHDNDTTSVKLGERVDALEEYVSTDASLNVRIDDLRRDKTEISFEDFSGVTLYVQIESLERDICGQIVNVSRASTMTLSERISELEGYYDIEDPSGSQLARVNIIENILYDRNDISDGFIDPIPSSIEDFRYQIELVKNMSNDLKYGMYYGYHDISFILKDDDRITILNKGLTSTGIKKDQLIQLIDNDSDVEIKYLDGLDVNETGIGDSSYNFYDGNVSIRVIGDFESCSLYSLKYGYIKLEDVLIFDKQFADFNDHVAMIKSYPDISQTDQDVDVFCLYPESKIYFDTSAKEPVMILNYKDTYTYDYNDISQNKYGLYKGQYIIKGVTESNPIAVINNGITDYLTYFGSSFYKKRLGPDKNVYDFYYGTIVIEVFGDFGSVSLYDYHDGFCGGKNILVYTDLCIDLSDNWVDNWYETNSSGISNVSDVSASYDISYINNITYESTRLLESYIDCSINNDVISFSTASGSESLVDLSTNYGLNKGTYVLLDVPMNHSIAFLNNGIEDKFDYDGYNEFKTTETAPDNNKYDFYYGNVNIYINDDFSNMSYITLNDISNGDFHFDGFRKIKFSEDASLGNAIPHYGRLSNNPLLETDISSGLQSYLITVSVNIVYVNTGADYVSFRLNGRDRRGDISPDENNPSLLFQVGDCVLFEFEYETSNYSFGIYEGTLPFTNNLITTENVTFGEDDKIDKIDNIKGIVTVLNNLNNTSSTIVWFPNKSGNGKYSYRSSGDYDYMEGIINIEDNSSAKIPLDISSISINSAIADNIYNATRIDEKNEFFGELSNDSEKGSTGFGTNSSILMTEIKFEYTLPVLVNSDKKIYIYDNSNNLIVYTFTKDDISVDFNELTLNTGFTKYNDRSLEFDTSYSILIDIDLVENIYYEGITATLDDKKDKIITTTTSFTTTTTTTPTTITTITTETILIGLDISDINQVITDESPITTNTIIEVNEIDLDTTETIATTTTTTKTIVSLLDVLTFKTGIKNQPKIISVFPHSTDIQDISGSIYIEFDRPINYNETKDISFSDIQDESTSFYESLQISNPTISDISININISGGSQDNDMLDVSFTDFSEKSLNVTSGAYKFIRGVEYNFYTGGMDSSYNIVINYGDNSANIDQNGTSPTTITIPLDISNINYVVKYQDISDSSYNMILEPYVITVNFSDLNFSSEYRALFDDYAFIDDDAGVELDLSNSLLNNYNIKTREDPRPSLLYWFPRDLSGVETYYNGPISLIFSQQVDINKLVAEGDTSVIINIYQNDNLLDSIDTRIVDDLARVSGQNTNTINISPLINPSDISGDDPFDIIITNNAIKTASFKLPIDENNGNRFYQYVREDSTTDSISFTSENPASSMRETIEEFGYYPSNNLTLFDEMVLIERYEDFLTKFNLSSFDENLNLNVNDRGGSTIGNNTSISSHIATGINTGITIFLKYKINDSWRNNRKARDGQVYVLYEAGNNINGIFIGLNYDLTTLFCYGGLSEGDTHSHDNRWFETTLSTRYNNNVEYYNSTIILALSIRYDIYTRSYKATLYHNNVIVSDVLDISLNIKDNSTPKGNDITLIGSGDAGFGITANSNIFSDSNEANLVVNNEYPTTTLNNDNKYAGEPMEFESGSYAFVVKDKEYSEFGLPLNDLEIYTPAEVFSATDIDANSINNEPYKYFRFNDPPLTYETSPYRYILRNNPTLGVVNKYIISNISRNHPIAILNNGVDHYIEYKIPPNSRVSQVVYFEEDRVDLYDGSWNFLHRSYDDDESIADYTSSIYDQDSGYMRGGTYEFDTTDLSGTDYIVQIRNGDNLIDTLDYRRRPTLVTIPLNIDDGSLNYILYDCSGVGLDDGSISEISYNEIILDLSGTDNVNIEIIEEKNMKLLYKEVTENGITAYYDFYYGSIEIDVYNAFGSVSYYCFYHGYMLYGKYAFTSYDSTYILD